MDIADEPRALSQEPSWGKVKVKTLEDFFRWQPDIVSITTTADGHFGMFKAAVEAGIKTILLKKVPSLLFGLGYQDGWASKALECMVASRLSMQHISIVPLPIP